MTFSLYGTTFVDSATPVPAAFLNKMRTELPSAVDGRGGSYTNTTDLVFTTAGGDFKVSGADNFVIDTSGVLNIQSEILGSLSYFPASVSSYVDIFPAHAPDAVRWVHESANPTTLSTAPRWKQQAGGQDYPLLIPLRIPAGQTLTGAAVRVLGASVAGGTNVPGGAPSTSGSSPQLDVMYRDVSSTSLTSLGSGLDTQSTVANYNTAHSISVTGLSETVSASRLYYLMVKGEAGINSNGALEVLAAQVTLTVSSQSKWYG